MRVDDLRILVAYDRWATRRILDALAADGVFFLFELACAEGAGVPEDA